MLIFNELGLLNGEYVVITVEVIEAACREGDSRDEEACRAFQGIIDVGQYIPDSQAYKDFETSVYNRMPEMNYTMNAPNEVIVSHYYRKLCAKKSVSSTKRTMPH